ncbi:MAG: helix-turn-helix domain-containing protein [Thiothrix sp.]|nr:helix-turn-helix domain-containing protein [Thiothrix sp.]HPQ96253.1 helix-turn-helix domain-containing protein [Thiolinea sp.]
MSKENNPTTYRAGHKVLRVLAALRGHTLDGLSNKQLSDALNESPSTITHCLNTLEREGFVQKLETGRYAHSIALLQIAQAHANHVQRSQARINEINSRVLAGAHWLDNGNTVEKSG